MLLTMDADVHFVRMIIRAQLQTSFHRITFTCVRLLTILLVNWRKLVEQEVDKSSKGEFGCTLKLVMFLPELFHNICGLEESCFLKNYKPHVHNGKIYNN